MVYVFLGLWHMITKRQRRVISWTIVMKNFEPERRWSFQCKPFIWDIKPKSDKKWELKTHNEHFRENHLHLHARQDYYRPRGFCLRQSTKRINIMRPTGASNLNKRNNSSYPNQSTGNNTINDSLKLNTYELNNSIHIHNNKEVARNQTENLKTIKEIQTPKTWRIERSALQILHPKDNW